MTGLDPAIPWLTGGLAAFALLLLLHRPIKALLKLVLRSAVGLAMLTVVQEVGGLFGITLGANLGNALVLGLLGVPGFGLLLMVQWLLKT